MGFYDSEQNVDDYIKLAKGFDGRELIEILKKHVPEQSTVLELGMGPGVDLEILNACYRVTGSDSSKYFVDRFKKMRPEIKVVELDAKYIDIDNKFDCIYSNKVLIHLTNTEIAESLVKQNDILNDGGVLFHTFWCGEGTEIISDSFFNYVTVESLQEIVGDKLEILEIQIYTEMEDDDSIYIILRKK